MHLRVLLIDIAELSVEISMVVVSKGSIAFRFKEVFGILTRRKYLRLLLSPPAMVRELRSGIGDGLRDEGGFGE